MLNTKVLVLNRAYLPIHVTSVRRACSLLYQGIARAVNEQYQTFDFESWSALARSAPRGHHRARGPAHLRVPRVIVLLPTIACRSAGCASAASTCTRATATPASTAAAPAARGSSTSITSSHVRRVAPRPGRTSFAPVFAAIGGRADARRKRRGCISCAVRCARIGLHSYSRRGAYGVTASGFRFSRPSMPRTGTPSWSSDQRHQDLVVQLSARHIL